ncbi:response regulator [Paenibacillus sp. GCM10012307]|uniref:Response regulator n=1 Tax=Paenibacillus roseus TaxID=2798579 RepID=A0A934J6G6_9BACL|nr:response regulator [Paenibacillus roseus]MBJ6363765.1 response regulator [Paenibacillus roseus]
MFNVVIVEDEKPSLELMKVVIGRNLHYTIIGAFTNPLEALASMPELTPDIVFLDVEMPKMNGLELARKIHEISRQIKIVFTTAYKHYALEAFEVNALDYILKPVTPAAIERITERMALQLLPASNEKKPRHAAIQCFGSFEVRSSEGALIRFQTRKTEELFAYFLCHANREIGKWQLMDLLWPDIEEGRASHSLHQTIYQIKKMLKEHAISLDIQKTGEGYILETGDMNVDVLDYQRLDLTRAGQLAEYREMERLCSMYRGQLLEGKPYLWKVSHEEAFGKQYTALTRSLIERDLSQDNWNAAEHRLDSYLAIYPLHEEMNGILMDLYASRGFKEKIARHYARFEEDYRRELGLELPQELSSRISSYLGQKQVRRK